MLEFKNCPYRNSPYMGRNTEWIVDIYRKYFNDKHDGFLVEIGVGCTLDWSKMGTPRILDWETDEIIRGESHTIELLENGWTGIYIESIHELIDNELEPLLKQLLPKDQLKKIKMVKCGASDKKRVTMIHQNESLSVLKNNNVDIDKVIPYNYNGRKLLCDKTSSILKKNKCPYDIDFMLIDVEGHEINVLNGLDFSLHRPRLLLIEVAIVSLDAIRSHLPEEYILIGNDWLNAMFVHSDFHLP